MELSTYQSVNGRLNKSGKIVNETIRLIKEVGRPVKLYEVLSRLREVGLTVHEDYKMQGSILSAYLINETKRRYSRITKPTRNTYDIKTKNPQPSANGAGVTETQTKN